jgi:outer membrane protein assembly factor BamB
MYQLFPTHNAVLSNADLDAAWETDAGGQINGGVAVSSGRVVVDTFNKEVLAIDIADGFILWRSPLKDIAMSTPVISNGVVFVGTGHNGRLHQSANQRYKYTPNEPGDPTWGTAGGDDIVGITLESGKTLWTRRTVGEDMPSPAIAGGTLVLANGDLHAYGIAVKSGDVLWRDALDGYASMASAMYAGNRAYVSVCNDAPYRCSTVALDPESGKILWRSPHGHSDSSPTYGGGLVFVSGVDNIKGEVYPQGGYSTVAALDAKTGKVMWTYSSHGFGPYTEVASNERAITGTFAAQTYYQAFPSLDELVAFNARSGRARWTFHSEAPIKMSPIINRGRLYVGDIAGILYVIDASNGALLTSRLFAEPFTTSPPVVIGNVVIVANDTHVYAIPIR